MRQFCLLIILLCCLLGEVSFRNHWLAPLEKSYTDLWHQLAGDLSASEANVVIVPVDQPALDAFPDDPLVFWGPHFAKAIARLRQAGAVAVGMDFLFAINAESWLQKLNVPASDIGRTYEIPMREQLNSGQVVLVDSLGASLLQGLLVLKATELAELALPPREIVEELNRIREQSGVILTVDRFDRLLASGRVGRGKAWLASTLGLKPIMAVPTDGRATVPVGKALGRKRVLPAVMKALREAIPVGAGKLRFGVIHVARPEIVQEAASALRENYGDVEILSAPATPVLATHTGIGAWAISYLVED